MKRTILAAAISLVAIIACVPDVLAQNAPGKSKWEGRFTESDQQEVLIRDGDGLWLSTTDSDVPGWAFVGRLPGWSGNPEDVFVGEFRGDGRLSLVVYDGPQRQWLHGEMQNGAMTWAAHDGWAPFSLVEGGPSLFVPPPSVPRPANRMSNEKRAQSPTPPPGLSVAAATAPVAYPVYVSRRDNIPGTGLTMNTSVFISPTGQLFATTRTTQATLFRGATGGVAVVLLRDQHILWASKTMAFGVDGRMFGRWDRYDSWTDIVPAQLMAQANGVAIVHFHAPKSAGAIFTTWLGWVVNNFELIRGLITKFR